MILTYPRSGSSYLQQLIKQKLYDPNSPDEILIPKTNSISDTGDSKIISIARCPYRIMHSLVALVLTFPESPKFKFESEDGVYRFPANEYINLYQYMIDKADIIIDYDDLVSRPDEVIDYLAKEMSLEVRDAEYVNQLFDGPDHLVSSENSPIWKSINYTNHLPGDFGMFRSKYEHKRALEKCILK